MKVAASPDRLGLAHLAEDRAAVDAVLAEVARSRVEDVPAVLAEPLRYALEGGGKRLRPLLCVAAYRAVTGAPGPVHRVAAALEIIHTYSLVHDDLPCMDDDALRRGRPTTHRAFGVDRAVIAGVAMIPLAFEVLCDGARALGLDEREGATLVMELARAAGGGGMVGGQQLDIEAEGRALSIDQLEAMHRRKTGALFRAALRLGALAARADATTVQALGDFGEVLGLAFQITDDVLDETGRSEVLGKIAGRDRQLAKPTFVALLGIDEARLRAEAAVERAGSILERVGVDTTALTPLLRLAVERDH